MGKRLCDAKIFEKVNVEKDCKDVDLKCRIMELQITKGAEILVKRFADMGSPMEIFVRGYNLCFWKNEARNIFVC